MKCKQTFSGTVNINSLSFWWSLPEFHLWISFISQIVWLTASNLPDFGLHRGLFFLPSCWFFGPLCLKALMGLLLEQYSSSRDLVIRSYGLLQVLYQLNDNSLLKTFFQRSIIWSNTIVILLYHFYGQTFVYGLCANKQIKSY